MVARLSPNQKVVCSNHVRVRFLFSFTLLFELFKQASFKTFSLQLAEKFFRYTGPGSAMIARLIPGQKVAYSNLVGVRFPATLTIPIELFEQASYKN